MIGGSASVGSWPRMEFTRSRTSWAATSPSFSRTNWTVTTEIPSEEIEMEIVRDDLVAPPNDRVREEAFRLPGEEVPRRDDGLVRFIGESSHDLRGPETVVREHPVERGVGVLGLPARWIEVIGFDPPGLREPRGRHRECGASRCPGFRECRTLSTPTSGRRCTRSPPRVLRSDPPPRVGPAPESGTEVDEVVADVPGPGGPT